ncbi:MAG: hypothetical protein ACI4FZ_08775 [Lachnospiraceae bacterium]
MGKIVGKVYKDTRKSGKARQGKDKNPDTLQKAGSEIEPDDSTKSTEESE